MLVVFPSFISNLRRPAENWLPARGKISPDRQGGARLNNYLFIESRCDQESPDVSAALDLAGRLCAGGHDVTVFLIQNAVAMAAHSASVPDLVRRGVHVWVDDFSISVRGFDGARCSPEVRLGGAPDLVRLLMTRDVIPVWH